MAGVLDGVNQRTQLVGRNRLELLLFRLGGRQLYGINVFKVQEVIQCPALTHVPHASPIVRGVASLRGKTIAVVDLARAIGKPAVAEPAEAYVIITEYNRSTQGFLVRGVERIVNMNWQEILPPPRGAGRDSYMTAVTNVDGQLVEIIDVEKVLAELVGSNTTLSDPTVAAQAAQASAVPRHVLIADDSSVARKQIQRTLAQMNIECVVACDGMEALDLLKEWSEESTPVSQRIAMVISDVEMPKMDGYTLTKEIRADAKLQDLYVLLHTSLSGTFNHAMIEKVGANKFIAKFNPDEFARNVSDIIQKRESESVTT